MRPPSTSVTLHDVAHATGVSVNTVSRALTGKTDISARTRAHVLEAANRLGYRPNLMARSLVQGRTRSIGLLVTDCTHPFYATLIRAVEEVAFNTGYSLLLSTSSDSPDREATALHLLAERRVDGFLLSPVRVTAAHLRALIQGVLPNVLLTRRPAGYKGPFVGTDNVQGARLATRHLLELGHRRIAHVTTTEGGASATARLQGFRRALSAARIPIQADHVVSVAQTIDGGRAAAASLLGARPRPTAVFAYNDLQAAGLMLGLRESGVTVPGDMSVIGFDGIDLGKVTYPPLTTIAQQIDRIGRIGAQLLIDSVEGRAVANNVYVLPAELIVRASTGPARR